MNPSDRDSPIDRRMACAVAHATALGIPNAKAYIELGARVSAREKDLDAITRDPVSGMDVTALELMALLESEGKDPMGVEFSRRRGYSDAEIEEFEAWLNATYQLMADGVPEDELAWIDGVASGALEAP